MSKWSRNNMQRSSREQKDCIGDSHNNIAKVKIFDTVTEIFKDRIDSDVIRLILEESEWKEETAIEKLIQIASTVEPSIIYNDTKPKVDLAIIACSLLEDEKVDGSGAEEVAPPLSDSVMDSSKKVSGSGKFCTFDPEAIATAEQSVLAMYDDILKSSNFFSSSQEEHGPRMFSHDNSTEISLNEMCCNSDLLSDSGKSKTHFSPEYSQVSFDSSENTYHKKTKIFSSGHCPETQNTCGSIGLTDKDKDLSSFSSHELTFVSTPSDSDESTCSTDSSFVEELELPTQNQDSTYGGQDSLSQLLIISGDAVSHDGTFPTAEEVKTKFSDDVLECVSPTVDKPIKLTVDTRQEKSDLKNFFVNENRKEEIMASENESTEEPAANTFLSAEAPEFVPAFFSSSSSMFSNIHLIPVTESLHPSYIPVQYSCYPPRITQEPPYAQVAQNTANFYSQVSSRNVALKNLVGRNVRQVPLNYTAAVKSSDHCVLGNAASKAQPPVFDVPPSSEFERIKQLVQHGGKLMVIMRGLPGSGKSHLARQIQGNGQVFSTDDYFLQNGVYHYSQENLSEAHAWNKKRVKDALDQGVMPVIVDNTNMMIWELLPYAQLANARGYEVEILEPFTPWRWQPKRLAKYNCHGVSIEAIKKMKDRFEVLDTSGLKTLLKSTKRELDVPSSKLPVAHSCPEKDKPANPRWSSTSQLQEYLQPLQQENSDSSHASNMLEMKKPSKKSKKKKKTREHQGETLKAWEYIHDLLQRGATDEEIDNIIYISQFTDAEKQEVQRQRKNLKRLAGTKITDAQSVNDGRTAEQLVSSHDSVSTNTEDRSIMEAVDKVRSKKNPLFHTKSKITNPEKTDETKDSSSLFLESTWEDPKPQRRSRVTREQRVSETEKSMDNNIPDDEKAAIKSECATAPVPPTSDIIDIINISPFEPQKNNYDTINDIGGEGVINIAPFKIIPTDHTMSKESSNEDIRKSDDNSDMIAETSTGSEDSASEVSHKDKIGTGPQALENDMGSNDLEKFASSCHDKTDENGWTGFSEVTDTLISDSKSFSQAPEGQDAGTESNLVPAPDSPRKKTRRKKHRMPAKPFLDDSIKQQFNIESWKAFIPENQITEGEHVENESSTGDFFLQKSHVHVASSQTEVKDFSMLFMVTSMPYNAPPLGEGYHCLCGKGRFISSGSTNTMTASNSRLKLMLDKGTSVDDALVQVEPNLEILQSCFPEVAAGHLHEVLEVCQGDMEWATNLILDWGVSTPFTVNDKHQLRQEMAKHHKLSAVVSETSSPTMLDDVRKSFQPASLFELCQGQLIKAGSTIIKDDLQCRVISSGYQRLQRIQSLEQERAKNIGWGEHNILESLDKFSAPNKVQELPGLTSTRTSEETAKAASAIPNLEQKRIKDLAEEVLSLSSSQSSSKSGSLDDLQAAGADFKSSPVAKKALDTVDISSSSGLPIRGVQTVSNIDAEKDLSVTVSHDVIKNLEQLFGPLPVPHDGNGVKVVVHPSTAKHLHSWMELSILQQQTPEEFSRIQQLREDEALAQKLQSLEETRVTAPQPASTNLPRKQPKKSASRMMSAKQSSAPVNLLDIMEEEMARQEMRESMLKQLEASGNHLAIATKLKREKLYKHFPGIDESFLEEIFQANSYCLETTVSVIEVALGDKQPVSTKLNMSAASSKNFDADSEQQEDIEMVKQQSIFDLVNTAWNGDMNQQPGAQNSEEFDYHILRQESYVHHRMRSECFEKAQEAYRRGMREVAIFYSQEGHRHTQLMQDANMRASQKILDARKVRLDQEMVLDLHGLHTDEAVAALKQVIAEKEKEFQQKPVHNRQFLYVITGRGKHSHNGVSRLRPAVTEYLSSSGHRFVGVHPGMLKVSIYSAS